MRTARLVYHSLNCLPADGNEYAQVSEILAVSRRNNQRDGITGALMFNGRHFVQVLEGPGPALEATFNRVRLDPRHAEVTLVDYAPIAPIIFSNWSMAFVGDAAGHAEAQRAVELAGFDPSLLSGDDLVNRICRFLFGRGVVAA